MNFPSFHPNKIFTVYFPGNSSLLKLFSSAISNFPCLLTSTLSFSLNLSTISFTFSKSSSFFYISFFAVNPFQCTKYFITPSLFFFLRSSQPSTLLLHQPLLALYWFSISYYYTKIHHQIDSYKGQQLKLYCIFWHYHLNYIRFHILLY